MKILYSNVVTTGEFVWAPKLGGLPSHWQEMRDTNDDNEDDEIEHEVITYHLHVRKRVAKKSISNTFKKRLSTTNKMFWILDQLVYTV